MAVFNQSPSGQTTLTMSFDDVDMTFGVNEDQLTWNDTFFTWNADVNAGETFSLNMFPSGTAPSVPTIGQIYPPIFL
jgi:hypothetical protein